MKILLWDVVLIESYKLCTIVMAYLLYWRDHTYGSKIKIVFHSQKNLFKMYRQSTKWDDSRGTLFLIVDPIVLDIKLWKFNFFQILWTHFLKTTDTIKNEVSLYSSNFVEYHIFLEDFSWNEGKSIVTSLVLRTKNERTFAVELSLLY